MAAAGINPEGHGGEGGSMNGTCVDNLAAAVGYAKRGWRVIPLHTPCTAGCSCKNVTCSSIGKHPRTKNGLKDATTEEAIIRGWWQAWPSANVGIVTGACSGLFVLDIDPRDGGAESFGDLCDAYGQIDQTIEARTGSGGMHLLFKHPGMTIGNSAGKLGKGLDTRGDGGYIVAAPSTHASGRRYEWVSEDGQGLSDVPPWLLATLLEKPKPTFRSNSPRESTSRRWLGRALADAVAGNRNATGYWLACQLRDNGVSEREAENAMCDYAARCPMDGEPYTQREALASLRSAYSSAPRQPAQKIAGTWTPDRVKSTSPTQSEPQESRAPTPSTQTAPAEELNAFLCKVADGTVYNVPMPWRVLTSRTNALLPGSIMTLCGDPGIGKTFWVLQALRFWIEHGYKASVMFVEKDKRFHVQRLLAQLEGHGRWAVDFDWIKANAAEIDAVMKKHWETLNFYGACIHSSPRERLTLGSLRVWIQTRCDAGDRVLVVDPITAADGGDNRWRADDEFMLGIEKLLTDYGASLVLVTHPKKGNRPGTPSAHDQALGAAYHRFADTNVWLYKPAKPRKVIVQTTLGPTQMTLEIFAQLHKTRNGTGGPEIGYRFAEGLCFAEQGVVLKESQTNEEEEIP